jgi:hypothetical protein
MNKLLWNVGQCLQDYTQQHPRRHRLQTRRRENLKTYSIILFFFILVDGVRLCFWTAATDRALVHAPGVMWVWKATVEWYWQWKTKEQVGKPVLLLFCPPQISPATNRLNHNMVHCSTRLMLAIVERPARHNIIPVPDIRIDFWTPGLLELMIPLWSC